MIQKEMAVPSLGSRNPWAIASCATIAIPGPLDMPARVDHNQISEGQSAAGHAWTS